MTKIIQQIELEIFKRFQTICTKNNIPYIALGGTMLGAVRHKGFIPWDDDIDVGLTRHNYQNFISVCANISKEDHYFLQTPESDENYALSYSKLMDQNTYIEERNNVNNAKKGVFLDIFPLDKIPKSEAKQKKQIQDVKRLSNRLFLKLRYNFIENPIRRFYPSLTPEQEQSAKDLKVQRESLMTQYDQDESLDTYKNLASQYSYESEIFTEEQLNNIIEVPFEDTSIAISKNYDTILKTMYGSYMDLPPENQRNAKHISRLIFKNQEYFS